MGAERTVESLTKSYETDKKNSKDKQNRQAHYKLYTDTALLAGQIMLKSGAETYRVEDTMCHILKTSGLATTETFATVTGIFVTLNDPTIDAITMVTRVSEKESNLSQVYKVNDVSRRLCSGKLTIEEAYQQLQVIQREKEYPRWMERMGIVMTASFFTLLLGGGVFASAFSAFNGVWIVGVREVAKKIKLNGFITDLLTSFIIALFTTIVVSLIPRTINEEIIIVGSIMPLVPGVAITNAIRDTLQGDYLSGGSRAIEAFVIAACIAVGIGVGLAVAVNMLGGAAA